MILLFKNMNVYEKLPMLISSIDLMSYRILKLPTIRLNLFLTILFILHVSVFSQMCELIENQKPQQFQTVLPEEVGFSSVRLHQLDTLFQSYIHKGTLPYILAFVVRHGKIVNFKGYGWSNICLLYTSDAADEEDSVDLGGRRIIKKK